MTIESTGPYFVDLNISVIVSNICVSLKSIYKLCIKATAKKLTKVASWKCSLQIFGNQTKNIVNGQIYDLINKYIYK